MNIEQSKKYEWGDGVFTLLSWFKKERVKQARVLVVGCGALGNEVVKNLALFGVGHIYVVDFDRIELSNLTRSVLFREEDAHSHAYKAEVVAKRAMEINPQIKVTPIVGNLYTDVGLALYRAVDVVIGCLDSLIARYLLNQLCIRADKTWIDGSIENLTGTVKVYTPGISCFECGLSRDEFSNIMVRTGCADVVRTQEQHGRIATTPISASIIGAIQVQEAMKIIHMAGYRVSEPDDAVPPFKTLEGVMLHYEGMTNSMRLFKNAVWKRNCPAHDKWTNVIRGESLSATMTVGNTLSSLKDLLQVKAVEINMCNNKFIDYIVSDNPEKEFKVMIPDSRLEGYIAANAELRKLSYRTLFHKSFYEIIDDSFPYQDLTLQQIGLPLFDILQVVTDKGLFYVELSADEAITL